MSGIRRRLLYAKPKEVPNYLCFTALESGSFTLTIGANLGVNLLSYVEYSLDGVSWVKTNNVSSTTVTITTPTVNAGDKVYWRGNGLRNSPTRDTNTNNKSIFSSTCKFDISGNIASYLFGKNYQNVALAYRAFVGLFMNCTNLVNAQDLVIDPVTTTYDDFAYLFYGCTSLLTSPDLSNIPINEYIFAGTFRGCTSLVSTSELPQTALMRNCYSEMYRGCTALTSANSIQARNFPIQACMYMYYGCTSLVSTASMRVDDAEMSAFFSMYQGCTLLTDAENITINSFTGDTICQNMFRQCSSLVDKIPTINASSITNGCFTYMYYQCSNLTKVHSFPALTLLQTCYSFMYHSTKVNYVKMYATDISATNCLTNWLYNVPNNSSCIFVKNINAAWTTTGWSAVPTNWTVIYYDPALDKYYLDQQREIECDDHGNPLVNPNYKIVPMEIEIYGKYQNPSSNTLSDNANYCTTYYYEIEDFDSVAFFPEVSSAYSFVYDENYDRLGKVGNINNANIKTVYPTAKYVRFSGDTNNNMKNPFMVFYNTTNYVQSEYALPKTSNIKLFKPEIAIRGKYLPATGVETNMGNYSISEYYEIVADRFQPYLNRNRSYCHAYDANEEWLFNLSTNTSIKGRDANATYIRISEETARMETVSYFGVMYNFENVI